MKIIQVTLRNLNNEILTTWVDIRPGLKQGAFITLKDFKPNVRWYVEAVHGQEHDSADFDFHRKWDNNDYTKHKGLFN